MEFSFIYLLIIFNLFWKILFYFSICLKILPTVLTVWAKTPVEIKIINVHKNISNEVYGVISVYLVL